MGDRLLVDTSAWILSFRATGNQKLKDYLSASLDVDRAVTTNIILFELLQGCKTRKEYDVLQERLAILPLFPLDKKAWQIANEAGYTLRRKGITVPTVDILICSIAKANSLTLLHHDAHLKIVAHELGIISVDYLKQS